MDSPGPPNGSSNSLVTADSGQHPPDRRCVKVPRSNPSLERTAGSVSTNYMRLLALGPCGLVAPSRCMVVGTGPAVLRVHVVNKQLSWAISA